MVSSHWFLVMWGRWY